MPKQSKKARTDARGIVRVTVALEDGDGVRIKGNRTASFKVGAASVGEVSEAIAGVFERPDVLKLKTR